jgi:hypothetical protein
LKADEMLNANGIHPIRGGEQSPFLLLKTNKMFEKTIHMKAAYWKGYTHFDRHKAIFDITNIIDKYGFISDSHMFSDIEISLKIEVAGKKVVTLYQELCDYMDMDKESFEGMMEMEECIIFLHVTFTHGTGNLKIEVPAVPG